MRDFPSGCLLGLAQDEPMAVGGETVGMVYDEPAMVHSAWLSVPA